MKFFQMMVKTEIITVNANFSISVLQEEKLFFFYFAVFSRSQTFHIYNVKLF